MKLRLNAYEISGVLIVLVIFLILAVADSVLTT